MKLIIMLLLFTTIGNTVNFQFNFGTGFDDTTVVTPVGGNSGTTLGQQRQILFQAAADIWGARIQSNVTIVVDAEFVPLTPCDNSGGVLGSAGPLATWFSSPPSNIIANTWYPLSLYNAITGSDGFPSNIDINSRFNSSIDNGCLGGNTFYYGINNNAPSGKIALFSTVLHELGHGLGVSSFASNADGTLDSGKPSIFDRFIFDTALNMPWTAITDSERLASMKNDPNLTWNGVNVSNDASTFINQGLNSGLVRLHAPATIEPGSSISHFSSAASPDLLMEPVLGNIAFDQVDLTPALFKDLGYTIVEPVNDVLFADGFEN